MLTKKNLPVPLKSDDSLKEIDIFDNRGNIQKVVDFLNEHYIIHISAINPEIIEVRAKNKKKFKYHPTFNDIYLHMLEECPAKISSKLLWEIISSQNYIEPFDPIEDYLSGIRGKYKGESHIDLLCSCLTAREFEIYEPGQCQKRINYLLRKWMVASIAQWKDNIPNPIMLTFIQQNEGTGKTELCKFIIPPKLKLQSCVFFHDQIKRMEDVYTRFYFVIHDELVGINKWTMERWKLIQTSPTLNTKRRLDKYEIERNKIAVSLATTNYNQERGGFIRSGESGRRYACIEFDSIDWKRYKEIVDVDQMWAESLMLYESSDYDYVLNESDHLEISIYNSKYMKNNSSSTYVLTLLLKPENEHDGVWMNPTEIIQDISNKKILQKYRICALNPVDIGASLTALGFRSENRRKCTAPEFENVKYSFPLKRYFVKRNY